MKNIHVLKTDKPSRIIKSQDNDFILLNTNVPNWFEINLNTKKQNIYITSDEEIKEGNWWLNLKTNDVDKCTHKSEVLLYNSEKYEYIKKIILTTDKDLIKDGVQDIDDEFLEWFVKNPSCEEVETIIDWYFNDIWHNRYRIIIPKEELIPPTKTTEDIKSIVEDVKEPTLTITLNKEEVRGLLNCIMRTSAKGKDLDVGEMVEDKLVEFLNLK